MAWHQRSLQLRARPRGCHLVTSEILSQIPELAKVRAGLMHLLLLHTSASLTVNENADADVRQDLEMALNTLAPEDAPYVHTLEGPDDMPAHIKASLMGCSILLPVQAGRLVLGTWQGIYLCEHRDQASGRQVFVTLWGETASAP